MTKVSRVLYSDKETNLHMLKECCRVAELGGTFSIVHEYQTNWFTVYTIEYPEESK